MWCHLSLPAHRDCKFWRIRKKTRTLLQIISTMSFVLHNCTSLFVLPLSLNKTSKAWESPSRSKGNMLCVIPIVLPACAFAPWIQCCDLQGNFLVWQWFYAKKVTVNSCDGSLLYSNSQSYFLLLQSTNLLCPFGKREWSTELWDSVQPYQCSLQK